jgi:hypothetical protein
MTSTQENRTGFQSSLKDSNCVLKISGSSYKEIVEAMGLLYGFFGKMK